VACPTTSHKVHGFGALGVGGAWGALSFESFFLALPPWLDAFTIGVVPVEVVMVLKQRQGSWGPVELGSKHDTVLADQAKCL